MFAAISGLFLLIWSKQTKSKADLNIARNFSNHFSSLIVKIYSKMLDGRILIKLFIATVGNRSWFAFCKEDHFVMI